MTPRDLSLLALRSLGAHRLRSVLTLAAMAIGVAAVIVLTALGEGARRYVMGEFEGLGSHLLIVLPGRTETVGGTPPLLAEVPRDLTLDDALALRRGRAVRLVAPLALGAAEVSRGGRSRESTIIGTTREFVEVRRLRVARGEFLPEGRERSALPVAVIGAKLEEELFRGESPLGRWIRIGDRRFRVIGVLGSEGRSLGLDLQEIVVIPVASAQALFDTEGLFRVLVEATSRETISRARREVLEIVARRHDGEEDVTVITQDAVLDTFDRVLRALTLGVAGIAGISLIVAGVLVMNVMLVAVAERTAEVGLLKALGAPPAEIRRLFLVEAALLCLAGGLVGLAAGQLGALGIRRLYPALPAFPPGWAVVAALAVAVGAGLVFGVLPARRAARLDPVTALSRH
jgi:putative ABC transport system permease protein